MDRGDVRLDSQLSSASVGGVKELWPCGTSRLGTSVVEILSKRPCFGEVQALGPLGVPTLK